MVSNPNTKIGALTIGERQQIENELFTDAGQALKAIRDYARGGIHSPVAMVVVSALWALSTLPGDVTFDAGVGPGSPNLFVALVGSPGDGKDALISSVRRGMTISNGQLAVAPKQLALGSGEGIVTALQVEEGKRVSEPVLFGMSEIGQMEQLMRRTGSTLRPNILQVYSGNALGFTNKGEQVVVQANTYTAGLWVGVQPDKAGALVGGADDGLSHRFIWVDLPDPLRSDNYDQGPAGLQAIEIPPDLIAGGQFTFDSTIVNATQKARIQARKTGVQGENTGHRHQTRLKLACGLALLRSSSEVSLADWRRSGVLMEYSDKVLHHCLHHLSRRDVEDQAKRLDQQEQAAEQVELKRVIRNQQRILEALFKHLADEGRQEALKWSPLLQARASRERPAMNTALEKLVIQEVIVKNCAEDGRTDSLIPGRRFREACSHHGVSYMA